MNRFRIAAGLGGLALLILAGIVLADIRVAIPGDIEPLAYISPEGPGFEPGVINDGTWAAIPFYRSPQCIPADFNLMDWFDPDLDPADCPLLVEGFAIWPGDSIEGLPRSTQLSGVDEVPVWFFEWSEVQDAMADGVLTIGELASLDSRIVGSASVYEEQLHFTPPHRVSHGTVRPTGRSRTAARSRCSPSSGASRATRR